MAMIHCLECKGQVSDRAPACPHCGVLLSAPTGDQTVRARPLSPGRAAATIAASWLFALIFAASLPRYITAFDRWPTRWGELPPLTHALMSIGRLGVWPIVLGGLGLMVVLAGSGAGWVRAGLPGPRVVVSALGLAGIGAGVACFVGTLGQFITLPPAGQW